MDRFSLTNAQWEKMQPFCLGKPTDPGRTGGDCRLFTEAVLWIARTGSPWRDLPASFGKLDHRRVEPARSQDRHFAEGEPKGTAGHRPRRL
jgi:transposase